MAEFNKKIAHDRILEIYGKYPKKMGKSAGMKTAIVQCKTKEACDELEQAVMNYIEHIKREGTERQFIMYFSTFMHQWKDWLEPDIGMTVQESVNLSGIGFDP